MTTLAEIFVAVRPDTTRTGAELNRKLSTLDTSAGASAAGKSAGHRFGSAMAGTVKTAAVGIGAALAGGGLVAGKFLADSVKSASDLGETSSKIGVLFGKSAGSVQQWAASMATDFGQSKQAALDGAATFAIYGKSAKLSGADLFNFSTDLSGLASDMASFSNTSPEEAVQAIGAAMRGESDPIEKYGVLLNESVLKNVALKEGIIKTTKDALTPQQRVLAVQAALYQQLGNKGSKTLGDFERTSGGLANQQRILTAQFANAKAEIGQGLLPVATRFVTQLNSKVMPALMALWREHGPQVTAFLTTAGDKFTDFVTKASKADFKGMADKVAEFGTTLKDKVVPALEDIKREGGASFADTIRVTGVVMKFLANNADTLAKALPYLAAGYGLVKVAQLAANVASAASPALRIAEVVANRRLAASNAQLIAAINGQTAATRGATVSKAADTAAQNSGILARVRATATLVAQRVATLAVSAATKAWAGIQLVLNAVMSANPIALVVLAIVGLVAAIVIAYKNSETFRNIVQGAWKGIQAAVSFAWNNVIKPAFNAIVGFVKNTLGPIVMWLWNNVIKPAWSGISFAIKAAWVVIQIIFAAFKLYLEKVLFPVIRFLYNSVVRPIFSAVGATIRFVWDKVVKPVFEALGGFISKHVAPAFSKGVGAIAAAWDKVKEAAAAPVRFIVDTVINKGIIGGINWIASKVGVKDRIPELRWGGATGSISRGANTSRNKPLPGDGYGQGDGIGDGLGTLLTNPAKWLSNRIGLGRLIGKFGNNPFVRTLMGAGTRMKDFAMVKVQSLIGELFGGSGGSVGANGLRSGIAGALGALRAAFGNVPLISGLRRGSRTLSGNVSYHSSGRAIDIPPVEAWAAFLHNTFGPRLRELITPWQQYNLLNGRSHRYTGAVWNQHNFAGGNAHIHAAMDNGGFLRPGWNAPIFNGTGRLEPVTPPNTMDAVVDLLERLIGAVESVAPGVGAEINGMGGTLRLKGRAR